MRIIAIFCLLIMHAYQSELNRVRREHKFARVRFVAAMTLTLAL